MRKYHKCNSCKVRIQLSVEYMPTRWLCSQYEQGREWRGEGRREREEGCLDCTQEKLCSFVVDDRSLDLYTHFLHSSQ